MIRQNFDVM